MIPQKLEQTLRWVVRPLVVWLAGRRWHPNVVSTAGCVLTALSGLFFAFAKFHWAGWFIVAGGLCDMLDGELARRSGRVSRFGALLDSALDRYGEFGMFLGLMIYGLRLGNAAIAVAAVAALCGSLMVSYVRARGEALGFGCPVGLFQRPERLLAMAIGAWIHPFVLGIAVWLVAVLAHFTAVQRLVYIYRQDRR